MLTSTIHELATPQRGYFTAAQAHAAGLKQNTIIHMARRGTIERVSRGVYRLANYPEFEYAQFMEAILWPQEGVRGVLSHESALVLHALTDANPAKVHITLPPSHRVKRAVPSHLVIHFAALPPEETEIVEDIPVTTPERSIADAHRSHLDPALIRQAIVDGRRTGKLTNRDADALAARLLGDQEASR